jgi:hypothetical protein
MIKPTDIERPFSERHFDREITVLCVCWYLHAGSTFESWSKRCLNQPFNPACDDHALSQPILTGVCQIDMRDPLELPGKSTRRMD